MPNKESLSNSIIDKDIPRRNNKLSEKYTLESHRKKHTKKSKKHRKSSTSGAEHYLGKLKDIKKIDSTTTLINMNSQLRVTRNKEITKMDKILARAGLKRENFQTYTFTQWMLKLNPYYTANKK